MATSTPAILALCIATPLTILGWKVAESPWPLGLALRHLAAAPNCTAARAVGLAPARRGEPGYYDDHDADHDGIACEPYHGRSRAWGFPHIRYRYIWL